MQYEVEEYTHTTSKQNKRNRLDEILADFHNLNKKNFKNQRHPNQAMTQPSIDLQELTRIGSKKGPINPAWLLKPELRQKLKNKQNRLEWI